MTEMNTKTQVIWSYIRSLPINTSFTAKTLLERCQQINPDVSSGSVSGLLARLVRFGVVTKSRDNSNKLYHYTLCNYDYAQQLRSTPSKGGKSGRKINMSKTPLLLDASKTPLSSDTSIPFEMPNTETSIIANWRKIANVSETSVEPTTDTTGKYVVIEGPLFAGCDVEEPTHIFESFYEAHTYASEQLRSTPTVEFVILKTVEIVRATVSIHSMSVDS